MKWRESYLKKKSFHQLLPNIFPQSVATTRRVAAPSDFTFPASVRDKYNNNRTAECVKSGFRCGLKRQKLSSKREGESLATLFGDRSSTKTFSFPTHTELWFLFTHFAILQIPLGTFPLRPFSKVLWLTERKLGVLSLFFFCLKKNLKVRLFVTPTRFIFARSLRHLVFARNCQIWLQRENVQNWQHCWLAAKRCVA